MSPEVEGRDRYLRGGGGYLDLRRVHQLWRVVNRGKYGWSPRKSPFLLRLLSHRNYKGPRPLVNLLEGPGEPSSISHTVDHPSSRRPYTGELVSSLDETGTFDSSNKDIRPPPISTPSF